MQPWSFLRTWKVCHPPFNQIRQSHVETRWSAIGNTELISSLRKSMACMRITESCLAAYGTDGRVVLRYWYMLHLILHQYLLAMAYNGELSCMRWPVKAQEPVAPFCQSSFPAKKGHLSSRLLYVHASCESSVRVVVS